MALRIATSMTLFNRMTALRASPQYQHSFLCFSNSRDTCFPSAVPRKKLPQHMCVSVCVCPCKCGCAGCLCEGQSAVHLGSPHLSSCLQQGLFVGPHCIPWASRPGRIWGFSCLQLPSSCGVMDVTISPSFKCAVGILSHFSSLHSRPSPWPSVPF